MLNSLRPKTLNDSPIPMQTLPPLVIATRNPKKCREVVELLDGHNAHVHHVGEFDPVPEVIEDGETFAENAAKKASQTAAFLKMWTIGEDSGLIVDALGGAPGVYSARYSGADATDASNNQKLIEELSDVPDHQRSARYLCHIALSDPQGIVQLHVERTCRGLITHTPRGMNGFGYDPYFLIEEYHQTFGELSPQVKKVLSHRARAFHAFIPRMIELLLKKHPD